MTNDELIISYAVKVNSGSGVLVSTLSSEFTYVLTASHVVDDPITVTRGNQILKVISAPYFHENYDCCIFKVEYQHDILQRIWRGELDAGIRISYAGYPRSNVGSDRPYKIYSGTWNDQANNLIVCNLDNSPGQESIEGMSGGGVYSNRNGHPYLWGIEARMDDEAADARYGRIRCHTVECFDQILTANQLPQMAPFYMQCFSHLKGDIFEFNAPKPENLNGLRAKLGELADWLIEQEMPAPHDLMMRYQRELLLGNKEPDSTILDRNLWISYFEFAVICSILDEVDVIDETYLHTLDRKRRFMYSCSSDNWLWKLSDLMKAARDMLDAEGTILVNSPQENAAGFPDPEDIREVLDDIASSPKFRSLARIDSAHGDITKTYSFAHLKGLRNTHVIDKHREYKGPPGSQIATLKENYDRAIQKG